MGKFVGNILVTGGCGFIGSHTSLVLLERGYRLIILDSLFNSSEKVINRILKLSRIKNHEREAQLVFIKGDLRDEILINNIFENYSNNDKSIMAVIHFAGLKSVNDSINLPIQYWDFNVKGTINMLKVMDKFKCFKLVFSSSASIYGNRLNNTLIKESDDIKPINPYGQTKETIEKILNNLSLIKDSKWNIAILRYFNPIGAHYSGLLGESYSTVPTNIVPIINKVASGQLKELEIYGNDWESEDGTAVRDYIHVMDLAEGHILALEYIFKEEVSLININLGTGKGTSVLKLINTFSNVNKVKVPYKFTSRRDGDSAFSIADNSLAKEKLNWEPKRNLVTMCLDSWNWHVKNTYGI